MALHIKCTAAAVFNLSSPPYFLTSLEFLSYLLPFFFLRQTHSYFKQNSVPLCITEAAKHTP